MVKICSMPCKGHLALM